MRQMFSIGERSGLQAGQLSTRTLLLRSHAVVIAEVCGFALSAEIHKAFPETDVVWRGASVALKQGCQLSSWWAGSPAEFRCNPN